MPRKSVALRLSQSQDLFAGYEEAGISNSYQGRFIQDSIRRLERNKGLSKKQRDWLDNLIEEGVPAPKGDPIIISKIDSALSLWANNADRSWESGVMSDFKGRFVRGYELSEKQNALFNKLIKRAEDDATGANLFTPTAEQLEDLEALLKLYKGYSYQWQSERPAVAKAVRRVEAFINDEGTIEVYHYDKLYKSMGSKLRKFKSPRFKSGDLGWVAVYDKTLEKSVSNPTTALTDAYIDDKGEIVNDWLVQGAIQTRGQDQVRKRR